MKVTGEMLDAAMKQMRSVDGRNVLNEAEMCTILEAAMEAMKPDAWITGESMWRLRDGGNCRGAVPVHASRSSTAKYGVYFDQWRSE